MYGIQWESIIAEGTFKSYTHCLNFVKWSCHIPIRQEYQKSLDKKENEFGTSVSISDTSVIGFDFLWGISCQVE